MSGTKKDWTTPADIREQVQRLWDRGTLLNALVDDRSLFPLRLTHSRPDSREISDRFIEVRDWIARLKAAEGPYRIVSRTLNHRVHGSDSIPYEIWIDSADNALGLIGKRRAAAAFVDMIELTRRFEPALLPWISKRPLRALELATVWPLMLNIVEWLRQHPRPAVYLRQIDIAGVHTKFIERHRGVLSELFDLTLPKSSIDEHATGTTNFCRRYGFRDKALRVRFRILDSAYSILPYCTDQEITLTHTDFARLHLPVETVFVTENEINFLVLPPIPRAMVIFGAGYGFSNLAVVNWLQDKKLYYWGDIDTHGFAILNQFRQYFPTATSFLMDRETLLAHRQYWEREPCPETTALRRLTDPEQSLFNDLRQNNLGEQIRLEQEKIGYSMLLDALRKDPALSASS
ncbi:MAG: hypothetical protein A3K90_02765 [Pelodictyon luteolum]|uniref:Wadjet protein JetD C-terminal domain-containing protein n=1 Tax=Pelodictyon luteolum TaxID=1100 RepID=A0A165LM87_PELLU|nr:DUF3322 domain-containing protein [Pelodictyon luteolum]KZK74214.1 MAG: hypothetical protein A3K90_02765 [Pelodictyon luteolum]